MRKKLTTLLLALAMMVTMVGITPLSAWAAEGPLVIYVDALAGDDTNDGLSDITAVKTLQKAFTLVIASGGNYQLILEDGSYASPGPVTIPAAANVAVTTAGASVAATVYKNPDTPAVNRLFEFNSSAFSSVSFDNITFTGDDPATSESTEKLGEGVYLYSCDKVDGNVIEFSNCIFENLQSGINQQYSDYLSVHVNNSQITAASPIHMEYGRNLTVTNSVLEMSEGESWSSVISLNGSTIDVQIIDNTIIGNHGAGRGIYEDVYSGTISGNTFRDLSVAVETTDMYSVMISDNIIETTGDGLDLETYHNNCSISVINNTILNKGLKTAGAVGIELDADDDTLTGSFVVQDNTIVNFYIGLDYTDYYTSDISFTLGGAGHGNRFWGNILNIEWYSYIDTPVDAQGNDWGTDSLQEVYARIYANGAAPSSLFTFDDPISTAMITTAYVDDDYTSGDADGHSYGQDAFASIMEALPYVASGGQILVADGAYIAPIWIDRPVHILGLADSVNLTRHPSKTEYGNVTTEITAPRVTLERLNFSDGDMGLYFISFSRHSYASYPDAYQILDCRFTDFSQTAIYEPGYTLAGYETVIGSTSRVQGNIITRTTDVPNGTGIYLINQSENLYLSNNTLSGDYNYGVNLSGQNVYAQGNSITVQSTYNESALGISTTRNLACANNTIANDASYTNGNAVIGLALFFNDTTGPSSKEIYNNTITGFNSGVRLDGIENDELYDVTIGGSAAQANDFRGNEFGLTSALLNFNAEPTNAAYNIWGVPDDQLSSYIQDSNDASYYGPVTYLPTASVLLSDDATLSGLSASGITLTPSFDSATTNYSADAANSVVSTTVSALPTESSADVTINGTPGTVRAIDLAAGNNIIEVVVTAEDGETSKTYTLAINRAVSRPSGGGSSYTPPMVTITTEQNGAQTSNITTIEGTVQSGTASAAITASIVEALLDKAQATGGTAIGDLIEVSLDVEGTVDALQITIPQAELAKISTGADAAFAVTSPFISITFDNKAIDTIADAATGGTIKVTASLAGNRDGRPIYDLAVLNGDKKIADFNGGHATVVIPYTLKAGENPNAVVVYYLTDEGNLQPVRGHYDAALQAVVFKTTHFSKFMLGYNPVSFSDVSTDAWYKNAIDFMAARGITSGTGENNFSPGGQLTRGQFVVLLMNAYQINTQNQAAADQMQNFTDAGNAYYTDYLLAARNLGIVNGLGNNLFAPEKEITRQEMSVMLYNALKIIDEMPTATVDKDFSSFNDAEQVAAWANEALSALVKAGVVGGSNNNLHPTAGTTRAEIAQVLYNLLAN